MAMQKTLFTIDLTAQGIMLVAALILSPTILLPLMIAIPLGGWQLGSALLKGLAIPSKAHLNYFLAASGYLFLLYFANTLSVDLGALPFYPTGLDKLWIAAAFAPPIIGSIWYFRRTYLDYKACLETIETV